MGLHDLACRHGDRIERWRRAAHAVLLVIGIVAGGVAAGVLYMVYQYGSEVRALHDSRIEEVGGLLAANQRLQDANERLQASNERLVDIIEERLPGIADTADTAATKAQDAATTAAQAARAAGAAGVTANRAAQASEGAAEKLREALAAPTPPPADVPAWLDGP